MKSYGVITRSYRREREVMRVITRNDRDEIVITKGYESYNEKL